MDTLELAEKKKKKKKNKTKIKKKKRKKKKKRSSNTEPREVEISRASIITTFIVLKFKEYGCMYTCRRHTGLF